MIAFADNLPLVKLEDGRCVAFERDWLVRSLGTAARRAGYPQWWLAEHVAESVTTYLKTEDGPNVLAVANLVKAVQSVLQVIGYSEVSRHFDLGRPIVRVSLPELAREAGNGFELRFFDLLRERLREAMGQQASHFELVGLTSCVKLLRARKSWGPACEGLRSEIVSFAREQLGTSAAEREISVFVK